MILNYKSYGEGEKVLIIVHGLFGSLDNWSTLGRRFSENHKVIIVDQRNHGHSFHSEEMNYEVMAKDLIVLMDELKIERAQFIGHSMGGKTMMKMAMIDPNRIERMVIADIGPKRYEAHHDEILEALHGLDLEEVSSRTEAEEAMSKMIKNRGVLLFLLKNLYWVEKGKLGWRMNLPVINAHMEDILDSVGEDTVMVPSLFIRGGKSAYILDEDFMSIQMQFQKSEIRSIPAVGHWLHAEAPDTFFDLVKEFIH
jgi:esterase